MSIIITICLLLLFAYIFDISSSRTKIPSVILLLILGWGVKLATNLLKISIPDLMPVLTILGTIGLILIVLEGSLELELNKSKFKIIGKSSFMAFFSLILMCLGIAYAFYYFGGTTFRQGLINAIPLAIISSAIAIPSARNLITEKREFITYESSLSDIFGVILFNFIILNDNIGLITFGNFFLQLIIIIVLSFASTVGLALLLKNIKHNVKFTPIVILIILIYSISKIYHLPSLVFILLFGLFIGNLEELKKFKLIRKLQPEILNKEVQKFKELIIESTFLIRALFFLLFGYMIETSDLINSDTISWAVVITVSLFLVRFILLKIIKLPCSPLLFIAPRGLITILLFLSIPISQQISIVNKSLIIQIILLTAFIMMFGLMNHTKAKNDIIEDPENHLDESSSVDKIS
ncbi:MAG: sodium:proton antiporter [Paludibacter sp.]|nr:sodium:proton antiporter [Paludibacter sp.]